MSEERRTSARRRVSLAAELETTEGRKVIAVCRDASDRGVQLLTQEALAIGSAFRVCLLLPTDEPPIGVSGRVVRCAPLEPELADVWSYRVGVELTDPPPELATLLDEIAAMAEG